MKIAMIAYDFPEYCINICNGLAANADVLLLLPADRAEQYRSFLHPALRLVTFQRPRLRQPLQQLVSVTRIVRQVQAFQPNVVHMQHGHPWFNLALFWLKRYPLVASVHDAKPHIGDKESAKSPRLVMRLAPRLADQTMVHAQQLKQDVLRYIGLPAERVRVITPAVDLLSQQTSAPTTTAETAVPTVLFFGRIWAYKGLAYLIQAEPQISARVPDVRFVIAGRGEDFAHYQQLMVHPERFTVYNQFIPDALRDALLQQASLVVLPYIDASQSGVVLLAYSFGKPVVATTVGSLPELVRHGQTGLVVPPRDIQALADAIVALLLNGALRERMGQAARHKVAAEHTPTLVAQQHLHVYEQAIASKGLARRRGRLLRPQL
jgi:glycosyltransferase involved in cell wall biosynthesis